MGFRDIAVHLDDSARCSVRLELALSLARLNFATVCGLYGLSDGGDAAASRQRFEEAAAAAGVGACWMAREGQTGEAGLRHHVITAATCSDLVIMGQPEPGHGPVPYDLVEDVLVQSGRPVLVVPYVGTFETIGRRPLIAWNGGRESARALHDALPLLGHAREARLVMIEDSRHAIEDGPVLAHLARHGIDGEVERLTAEDIGVMDLLLARLTDTGSDLLVMGAHGHYGLTGLHRGAGTRHILRHLTVPALMSH
jgi:nucleotide-binding universal stress UspA family protein